MSIGSISSGLLASLGGGLALSRAAENSGPISQIKPVVRRDAQRESTACPDCGGVDCACATNSGVDAAPRTADSSSANASESTYTPESLQAAARVRKHDENVPDGAAAKAKSPTGNELNDEQAEQVQKLKQRDSQVRQHEAAHQSAAGGLASGGATFEYETGPDGRRYAVGGEVNIDTSDVSGDPQATIAKLQQVRAAALAPADPSGQDRNVAAQASARIAKAQAELSSSNTQRDDASAATAAHRDDKAQPRSANAAAATASGEAFGVARAIRTQRAYQPQQNAGGLVNQFA